MTEVEPKQILTKAFLYNEFVVLQKSIKTIAKENNIKSKNSITQYLKKFNITRDYLNYDKILTKEFLYEEYIVKNKSLKELSKELNIPNKWCIKRRLLKYNIPVRKHTKSKTFIEKQKRQRLYEEITNRYWTSLITQAINRGIEFKITPEYAWNIYIKQNKLCKLSGSEIYFSDYCGKITQSASLDRIDSKKGYIKNNIQWVHKKVNKIKSNLDEKEFIEWCQKISGYNK